MTDDEPLAEVVRLHPERDLTDDDAPLHRMPEKWCQHLRVNLDRTAKKVICRECDREVSAFDFLDGLAGTWERWKMSRDEAERRARDAQARLTELLRLEANARARLKRLDPGAKSPERPWGEGNIRP